MKLSFLILGSLLVTSCINKDRQNSLIHATYTVGSRLKNPDEIRQSDFKSLPFVYVMAAPQWEVADFDKNQQVINDKYIHYHTYPNGEQGNALVPDLIKKVHNDGSKILISFPGTAFSEIADRPERRQKFARMMAGFVQKYNYDGVEVDWEHTVTLDLHLLFMKDIREALNHLSKTTGKKYYLTTALHSFQRYTPSKADSISRYVDWINIMTYDMGGGIWGKTAGHNTPLTDMQKILKENWSVFHPQKLCIGLANYGFYYKNVVPGIPMEKKLNEYGRYFDYNELPPLLQKDWTETFDSIQQVPYYFSPDKTEFITIDNTYSLEKKMDWVKAANYKGVFWWEFHSDFQPAQVGESKGTHAFIDFVSQYLQDHP